MNLDSVRDYCSTYDDPAWCNEWSRRPWLVMDAEGQGWTFGTNGYSLGAARGRLPGAELARDPQHAAIVEAILATPGLTPISVDRLREWLRPLGKSWRQLDNENVVVVGGVPVDAWRLLRAIGPLSGAALASSAWRHGTDPKSGQPNMVVLRQPDAVVILCGLNTERLPERLPAVAPSWAVVAP